MVKDGRVHVQGDKEKVMAILALLDMFPANFNIVTP
jgi:alkyl sulfatase BDS1-like metallo-beta-lactamase superfamily hydrolase